MKISKSHWMGHAIIALFFMSIVFATINNEEAHSDNTENSYTLNTKSETKAVCLNH